MECRATAAGLRNVFSPLSQNLFDINYSRCHTSSITKIYVFSEISNALSVQWTIAELACYTYSLVAVPLYDTLGTEAIDYIIDKGINKKGSITH